MEIRKIARIGYSALILMALLAGMVAINPPQAAMAEAAPVINSTQLPDTNSYDSNIATADESPESSFLVNQ